MDNQYSGRKKEDEENNYVPNSPSQSYQSSCSGCQGECSRMYNNGGNN